MFDDPKPDDALHMKVKDFNKMNGHLMQCKRALNEILREIQHLSWRPSEVEIIDKVQDIAKNALNWSQQYWSETMSHRIHVSVNEHGEEG